MKHVCTRRMPNECTECTLLSKSVKWRKWPFVVSADIEKMHRQWYGWSTIFAHFVDRCSK